MFKGGICFEDINLEAVCLDRATEVMDTENLKLTICLKCVGNLNFLTA